MSGGNPETTTRRRIGVFYSLGPHFRKTLETLRKEFPGAEVTIMVPPDYPLSDEERALADHTEETERDHYSPRDVGACLRLIRRIRRERFHAFVVMFDSVQLRCLAALAGVPNRLCCLPQGKLIPLGRSVVGVVVGEALRRAWGGVVYATLWLLVRLLPVRAKIPPP